MRRRNGGWRIAGVVCSMTRCRPKLAGEIFSDLVQPPVPGNSVQKRGATGRVKLVDTSYGGRTAVAQLGTTRNQLPVLESAGVLGMKKAPAGPVNQGRGSLRVHREGSG